MLSAFDAMVLGVLMKRSVRKMIDEFRLHWKNYVFQSLFATLAVFVVLYFLTLQNAVIIASIGATAFIVFAMPKALTANARNVIGGHVVGLFWGFVFSLIPHATLFGSLVCYSAAVGLSIFTMVVTDTEHPPASGTALGVAITGMHPDVLIAVVLSIVLLSVIHRAFKPYLRDLT
jgi:CBS-domain-containing membrane protein